MTDENSSTAPRSNPLEKPVGEAPVIRQGDGWAIELREGNAKNQVTFDRMGGIVRVQMVAVVRHPAGTVEQPITLVLREEDAKGMATSMLGELCRFF